jgi:hypothetical protein
VLLREGREGEGAGRKDGEGAGRKDGEGGEMRKVGV